MLPGEVGIALRGGHTTTTPRDEVPELATTERDAALVDRTAGGAAFDVVRRIELLLDHWGLEPPATLRSGGLAVRDLKATAAELQVTEPEAGLLIEVAHAAGLMTTAADPDGNEVWLPTDAFDTWAAGSTAERWVTLALAWLDTTRLPSLIGGKDPGGKTWNALAPDLSSVMAPEARALALSQLAQVSPGSGAGHRHRACPRWSSGSPGCDRAGPRCTATSSLRPSTRPGCSGSSEPADCRPPAARSSPTSTTPRWPRSRPHLPHPVDHVLLQADLTAVAPGPLETELARTLHLLADVESRGGATVYRFTNGSVRRAFDAGWSALEVHDFVGSVSRTPVPQPLTYLVDDVARTFGTVRVGQAEAFLRADDEAALTELLHNPKAGNLGLRRIAPTVLISTVPVDVLLPRLRELGAAPVVEAPDGTVRVARRDLLRARRPRTSRTRGAASARAQATVTAVVTAIRSGDLASASRPAVADDRDHAVERAGRAPRGDRDAGDRRDRLRRQPRRQLGPRGRPLRLEGGQLMAHDHRSDDERLFAVHRITTVTPLSPPQP